MAMQEVTRGTNVNPYVLLPVALAAIGAGCSGILSRKGVTYIHVADEGLNIQIANSVLDNWNSLLLATTQITITADNVDTAVITHETPDANMNYYVWLDGVEYSFGTVAAVAGVVTLNLATDTPGQYLVLLARQSGNYATGMTIITAEE